MITEKGASILDTIAGEVLKEMEKETTKCLVIPKTSAEKAASAVIQKSITPRPQRGTGAASPPPSRCL
jgi:hypothetical protein